MLELPTKSNELCAVVVTYHPDPELRERLERLRTQVGHVVIVDNTPRSDAPGVLAELRRSSWVSIVADGENHGIATALNRGVAEARARGFSWVVTFDQDSQAESGLVDNLLGVWREAAEGGVGPIGMLGTNHVDRNSGERYVDLPTRQHSRFIERATVITSGSLFNVATYDDVGPFRDDFFIDSVDQEYCLRARRNGYRVLLATEPLLVHEMGKRRSTRLPFGHAVQTANYPAFRWYFIVKNLLTVAEEYAAAEPQWTAARLAGVSKRVLLTLLLEEDRIDKVRCMGLGAFDFATGRATRTPNDISVTRRDARRP